MGKTREAAGQSLEATMRCYGRYSMHRLTTTSDNQKIAGADAPYIETIQPLPSETLASAHSVLVAQDQSLSPVRFTFNGTLLR